MRKKLPVSKKPVFAAKIGRGLTLGYRRNKAAGTWVVRVADGKGGNWIAVIGTADDLAPANNAGILDFWQAQDHARAKARRGKDDDGDDGRLATIAEALGRYEADLKVRAGDVGNAARVKAHLPAGLARKSVALVTTRELRSWRDGLADKLAPATVNRTTNVLKAALNLAADHDERIGSRRAWETGLASIHDAEESRNVILEEPAIRAIITEANRQSVEFGLLAETAAVTGARVSQIARIEVQDLQDRRNDPRLMMPGSRKGRGQKKISRRPVPIPAGLAAKLRNAAGSRPMAASLLTKPSGEPWKKSDHSRLFARAAKAAGLDPNEVTIYALRHSSIVRQILASVPVRVVAVNHDTSVAMIERTYSRYIGDHTDALARKALLDIAAPPSGNVVPISAAR
jgi:integrase